MRVFRLAAQSIWQDEATVLLHFEAPDLTRCLALMDLYMPINMKSPLYYVLQYWFARHVSDSLLALRLLAVTFGVLCIPVLYALVRRMFGHRPALFAALLLALSPQHVWFSQEVRTYALSTLLSLCSFYCLFRAVEEGGRRWWAASLLINAVLPWTHLMFSLAVFAEGCFLLWLWWKRPVRIAAWALAQFALMTPMVFHLFPLPFTQDAESPTQISTIFVSFFAVDSVNLYTDLLPNWKTAPESVPVWAEGLLLVRTPADILLASLFVVSLAAVALGVRRGHAPRGAVFCLCVWMAPTALLAALNLATNMPFLSNMYFMYGAAGSYGAAAWTIFSVRRPFLRRLFAAGVIGLFLFNLALLVPFTTRTDWKGATDHVVRHKGPGDRLVNFEFFGPSNPIECYRDAVGIPVERASTVGAVCSLVTGAFLQPAGPAPEHVWIIYRGRFRELAFPGEDTPRLFRDRLGDCGIGVTTHFFPGQYNVTLLEASVLPGSCVASGEDFGDADDRGHRELLGVLGMRFVSQEEEDASLRALRRVVGWTWPGAPPIMWLAYALDLVVADRPDLAESLARWQLKELPKAAPMHFALAVALCAQGRVSEAGESFETAYRLQPSLRLLTAPLVGHLLRGDREAARAELERMRPWGWAYYIQVFDHLLKDTAVRQ